MRGSVPGERPQFLYEFSSPLQDRRVAGNVFGGLSCILRVQETDLSGYCCAIWVSAARRFDSAFFSNLQEPKRRADLRKRYR